MFVVNFNLLIFFFIVEFHAVGHGLGDGIVPEHSTREGYTYPNARLKKSVKKFCDDKNDADVRKLKNHVAEERH